MKPAMSKKFKAASATIHSRFGTVCVEFGDGSVTRVSFRSSDSVQAANTPASLEPWQREILDLIEAYLAGEEVDLARVPVDLSNQPVFRRQVQEACRCIPYGTKLSYAELAARAGHPLAARAVGSAMSNNPVPLLVPCHRVVRTDGKLGGFSAPQGVRLKERLLAMETGLV